MKSIGLSFGGGFFFESGVTTSDGSVSLLVDEIGDVLDVDDDLFERPPDTLDPITRTLVRGAYKLDGQLLLVLETDRAVGVAA